MLLDAALTALRGHATINASYCLEAAMTIAIGNDHAALSLKKEIIALL